MAKSKVYGVCHICQKKGELSEEHVPPKSAFNDRSYILAKAQEIITLGPDEIPKGKIKQGGIREYTLCHKCNSDTGGWYGRRFVGWCHRGMGILSRAKGNPASIYINHQFPLAILKQIISMFCSVNPETFTKANPEIIPFLLNKEKKYLNPKYRIFCYYNIEGRPRYANYCAKINPSTGDLIPFSEISFPPFGYVLTINSSPPDNRLFEITHFSSYNYNEFAFINLKLPVLPTHLWLPGDYRSMEEIRKINE
jgi:hypothetical protein